MAGPSAPDSTAAARVGGTRGGLLTNIQAMRALAVMLVLGYHLRPDKLSGGYVGVDVFFAISGYLMTAHLLRRTDRGDSLRATVLDFYSRRIRRILPASLLVLTVVAVVSLFVISRLHWHRYFDEIRASALYYENWSLASTATNYLGGNVTSPVQHFWSLSVEEQFYLGWPILLATLGIWLGRRGRYAQLAAITAVLLASLAYSIHVTDQNPAVAYFTTFGRLWEFAIGGLVAWFALIGRLGPRLSAALAWVGLGAIAYAAFTFTGQTRFPGFVAALPVIGAAALMSSGERSAIWGPHALMRLRPVQYLGDVSYSIYLWHMPLIEFYPKITDRALNNASRVGIVLVSIGLASFTKRFVEDPLRRRPSVGATMRVRAKPLAVCAVLMVPPVVISLVAISAVRADERRGDETYAEVTEHPPRCYGALTLDASSSGCQQSDVTLKQIVPSPFAAADGFESGCQQVGGKTSVLSCTFGIETDVQARVALVGDSHATHWLPALRNLAASHGWQVSTYLKAGCAFSTDRGLDTDCVEWNHAVMRRLLAERYSYVIVSARSSVFQPTSSALGRRVDGLVKAWRAVESVGSAVIAIKDVPQPILAGRGLIPDCVYEHGAAGCSFDRARAERLDIISRAAAIDSTSRLVDLNDSICPGQVCQAVVGDVMVYADDSHLTATYVRSMTQAVATGLKAAGMP